MNGSGGARQGGAEEVGSQLGSGDHSTERSGSDRHSAHIARVQVQGWQEQVRESAHLRSCDVDSTLEAVLELALSAATGKHLCLDHNIL